MRTEPKTRRKFTETNYFQERGNPEVVVVVQALHDCLENAQPVATDGPLGHGWACAVCGAPLQAG